MAEELGYLDDPAHWNATIDMPYRLNWYQFFWEQDDEGFFGNTVSAVTETRPSGRNANWGDVVSMGVFDYPR